ncbi:hypothetical protein [Halomicronema sp. CCY15110]|uniref:hypothetical protein n=1 Tax=Halomicronema sp. CCY15110 TaxID=2767773 RepID=UPI00194FCCCE|nr:hypothetical protein [Halomicronema sp. CCY15110]
MDLRVVPQGAIAASYETKLWRWSKNNEGEFTMPIGSVFSRFTDLIPILQKVKEAVAAMLTNLNIRSFSS